MSVSRPFFLIRCQRPAPLNDNGFLGNCRMLNGHILPRLQGPVGIFRIRLDNLAALLGTRLLLFACVYSYLAAITISRNVQLARFLTNHSRYNEPGDLSCRVIMNLKCLRLPCLRLQVRGALKRKGKNQAKPPFLLSRCSILHPT